MPKHIQLHSIPSFLLGMVLTSFLIAGSSTASDQKNTPTMSKAETSASVLTLNPSKGDREKLVGVWHTCSLLPNGKYFGNSIGFAERNQQLTYTSASGISGEFSDAACSKPAGNIRAITSMMHVIEKIEVLTLKLTPDAKFTGNAENFINDQGLSLMYLGLSADFKTLYLSKSGNFEQDAIAYKKIE